MNGIDWDAMPHGGDLYGEMHLAETSPEPRDSLVPGLLACGAAAGASAWLADQCGFPVILLGLLVGLSLNFIGRDPGTHRGLDFASRTFLRLGIVALGLPAFAALLAIMAATVAAGFAGARLAGQGRHAGLLADGAKAICGASAALALLVIG